MPAETIQRTFRIATVDDLPQLKQLVLRSWNVYKDQLEPQHWQQLYKNLDDDNTYADLMFIADCIVTETGGRIVAMAYLVPNGNPTPIYHEDWSYIRFLSVDPQYSGQGLATAITRECIRMATENGESVIALHTGEMMQAARHIYEKLGFTIDRELDPRYGRRYWLYVKQLS